MPQKLVFFKSKPAICGQGHRKHASDYWRGLLHFITVFEKRVQQLKMVLKRDMENRGLASHPKITKVVSAGERRDPIRKADF